MSNRNGKVPGTYVSQGELNELGKLLTTMREYIVSHEARIELIEGWINEYMEAHAPSPDETLQAAADRAEEVTAENEGEAGTEATLAGEAEEAEAFENEGGLIRELADDSEEG